MLTSVSDHRSAESLRLYGDATSSISFGQQLLLDGIFLAILFTHAGIPQFCGIERVSRYALSGIFALIPRIQYRIK